MKNTVGEIVALIGRDDVEKQHMLPSLQSPLWIRWSFHTIFKAGDCCDLGLSRIPALDPYGFDADRVKPLPEIKPRYSINSGRIYNPIVAPIARSFYPILDRIPGYLNDSSGSLFNEKKLADFLCFIVYPRSIVLHESTERHGFSG